MTVSPTYLVVGLVALMAGILGIIVALTWLGGRSPHQTGHAPRSRRAWITLLVATVALLGAGAGFLRAAVPQGVFYKLDVEAVATTDSGQVYLISPDDTAYRCVLPAECTELKGGITVLYHPDKSSRNGIMDVHRG